MSKIKFEFLEYGKSNKNIDFHVVEKSDNLVDQHVQYYVDQTTLSNNTTFSFPVVYSFVKTRDVYFLIRRELRNERELGVGSRNFEQRFIVVIQPDDKSLVGKLLDNIKIGDKSLPHQIDNSTRKPIEYFGDIKELFISIIIELIHGNKVQIQISDGWENAGRIIRLIIAVLGFDRSLSIREPTFSYGLVNEVGDPNIIFTSPDEKPIPSRILLSVGGKKKYYNESKTLSYLSKYIQEKMYRDITYYEIPTIKKVFVAYASLSKQYQHREDITPDLVELHLNFTPESDLWEAFKKKHDSIERSEKAEKLKLFKYAVDRLLEADPMPEASILLKWVYLAQQEKSTYGDFFWTHPKLLDENKLASIGSSLLSDFLSNEEKSREAISIVQTRILPVLEEPKKEHRNLKLAWKYSESTDPSKWQEELKNILCWENKRVDNLDEALTDAVANYRPNEFKYLLENQVNYDSSIIKLLIEITNKNNHWYFDDVIQSLLKHPTGLVKLIETLANHFLTEEETIEKCFKLISTTKMNGNIHAISLKSIDVLLESVKTKKPVFKDEKPVIEYFWEHWEKTANHDDISSLINLLFRYFDEKDRNTSLSEPSYTILRLIVDGQDNIEDKSKLNKCIVSFLKHFNNKEDYRKFTEGVNYPITYYIINRHLEDREKHGNKKTSSTEDSKKIPEDKIKSILDSFDKPDKKSKFTTYWKITKENKKNIPWGETLAERVPSYVKWILWVVSIVIILLILLLMLLLIVTAGKFLSSMMIR